MRRANGGLFTSVGVAVAVSVASSGAALAGGIGVGTLLDYAISDVPDFDQKRDFQDFPFRYGLPPNSSGSCAGDPSIACIEDFDCSFDLPCEMVGGSMYCVPTSAINWMAYIADRGYPLLAPGPSDNWQSMDEYNRIGEAIDLMGQTMSTNPDGGTGAAGAVGGLVDWLSSHPGKFSVIRFARTRSYCPRLADAAKAGLNGQLVMAVVGYYKPGEGGNDWERSGGHVMSLIEAKASGNPVVYEWACRNPSRNDSTLQQSTFNRSTAVLTPTMAVFDGFLRTQDRLDWGNPTFFDAYLAIVPVFGLSNGPGNTLKTLNPVPVTPFSKPAVDDIASPSGTPFVTGALLPSYTEALAITDGGATAANQLWHIDLLSGEAAEIVLTEEPLLIATGRTTPRAGYIRCGRQIWCLSHPHFSLEAQATLPSSAEPDAMVYDDATDELLVLSTASSELLRYPAGLATAPTSAALPAVIAPSGGVSLAVGPAGEEIWVADQAAATLYRLAEDAAGGLVIAETLTDTQITSPDAIAINDAGQLIISNAGALLEFERDATGGWQTVTDPLFAGMAAGSFFDVVRTRTNFDPATMAGPEWRHVLPREDFGEPGVGIPAASAWALVALAITLAVAGTLIIRRTVQPPGGPGRHTLQQSGT